MRAKIFGWVDCPIESSSEPREITGDEILALSEKYDVMIHTIHTGTVKLPRVKKGERRQVIETWNDVKIIFLDEKGKRCMTR